MGQKKEVKLEDIADKLGVSIVTVSNALTGKKGVSEELREKIKSMANEIGYKVNNTYKENKEKKSYLIGVLVAERYVKEFPSFYMEIYRRIAQETSKKGHLTLLEVVTYEKENMNEEYLAFSKGQLSGIIIIGELNEKYINAINKACNVPIVCVDHYDIYNNMDYIISDSFGGMEKMTELLINQGYTDLAFVGTPTATKNIADRYLGYCKALKKAGLDEVSQNIIYDRDFSHGDYRLYVEVPKKLPEAFVCNCDKTAIMLIENLAQKGIKVPEDVSVVGYDNYYAQTKNGLKLTTYENDERIIARISVSTLLKRIEGKGSPEGVRIVEGYIIEGNTLKRKS